jgi:hypothetical protein
MFGVDDKWRGRLHAGILFKEIALGKEKTDRLRSPERAVDLTRLIGYAGRG